MDLTKVNYKSSQKKEKILMKSTKVGLDHKVTMLLNVDNID